MIECKKHRFKVSTKKGIDDEGRDYRQNIFTCIKCGYKQEDFRDTKGIKQDYCDWCYDEDKKIVKAFACVEMNGGLAGWDTVCKDCLIQVIKREIENVINDEYVGAKKRLKTIPMERKAIRIIEGLRQK